MGKRGSAGSVLILIFLIVVLVFGLYFLYLNLPGETQNLIPLNGIDKESIGKGDVQPNGTYTVSKQFYENMRFPNREISYHIAANCDNKRKNEALEAFSVLENETVLSFYSASNANAEIKILCSDIAPDPEEEGHFIAGEGGPTEIINTSLYSVIFSGRMSLYRSDSCPTTHVALHEVLHVLGFEHNNNPGSILYPTLDCSQEFDQYIADEIDRIYENDGLPDLKISEVNANKSARYLNFQIKIINQGLKDAEEVILKVYGDGEVIKFRDNTLGTDVPYLNLSNIEVGTTKIFTVLNARLASRGVEEVTFIIDEDNSIEELFENNNRVELMLG